MWYTVTVPEASVLTSRCRLATCSGYQPVVSIIGPISPSVTAQSLRAVSVGATRRVDPAATASAYVQAGNYLRAHRLGDAGQRLVERLADAVAEGGAARCHGARDQRRGSQDGARPGPGLHASTRATRPITGRASTWTAPSGASTRAVARQHPSRTTANPLIGKYAWRKSGLHRVKLELSDNDGNKSTYAFFVLVHNFDRPKVGLRVFVPLPGARQIRLVISHDMPVSVRLVVLQRGRLLALVPAKPLTGHTKTTVRLPLKARVSRNGFVVVSGIGERSQPATQHGAACDVCGGSGPRRRHLHAH